MFFDTDEDVDARLAHPLNYWIPCTLMNLLEEILQDQNNYAKGYLGCEKWSMI
jgi:hypothetical protein